MNATDPATRTAHSFLELAHHPFYMILSRCLLLDRDRPADPLVARERRDVLPFRERRFVGSERFTQVHRQHVHRATGN